MQSPGYGGRGGLGTQELDPVWAPDGKWCCSWPAATAIAVLIRSPIWTSGSVAGRGEPRRLTGRDGEEPDDGYSTLRFSPDGKRLFALLGPRTDSTYNATRLVRFDWPSMQRGAN